MTNDPADLQHLPPQTWDTTGRRAAWVSSVQQADAIRTRQAHGNSVDVRVEKPKGETEVTRRVKRIGLLPALSAVACFGLLWLLGNNCFKAITYKQHFEAGLAALSCGNTERAQSEFTIATQCDPTMADPYYYLAQAEAEHGSFEKALKDFQKAIVLNPGSGKYLMARAALEMKMHNYDGATEDCAKAVRADSAFIDAYRISATANIHLARYESAVADATKFLDGFKSQDVYRADALAKRGFAYVQLKRYDKGIEDYTAALAIDPDNGGMHAGRAVAFMHAGQWGNSIADCDRALELKPNDAAVLKVRGLCHAKMQLTDSSLADLDAMVKLHPTIDTHRVRGVQRLVAHDYLGTLEDFDYVLTAEPDDGAISRSYISAKRALQRTARRTAAVADAEPRARMPNASDLNCSEPTLVKRGYNLFMKGDTEPAIAYFAAALKLKPSDIDARRYLAHACVQDGRYEDAITQYEKLERVATLNRLDRLVCARAFVELHQPSCAINLYNELLAENAADDKARTLLIKTLLSTGSADEAGRLAAEGAREVPSQYAKYSQLFKDSVALKFNRGKTL